jgi:ABC-2 type transport system permease protein
MRPAAESAAGTIYDIGYQRYEGARLGRGNAFRTLFGHSLRQAWGLGRRGRALVVPFGLLAVISFPAVIQVLVDSISNGQSKLIGYADYFAFVQGMVVLFCAAQGPELVSNDQHDRVLPLYFSRPLSRADYAGAKLAAMVAAVWLLVATPMLLLFVGRLSAAPDTGAALRTEGSFVLPVLGTTLAVAAVMGSVSVALAAVSPRRALASAAIFAVLLLSRAVVGVLEQTSAGLAWARLVSPTSVLGGVIRWLFVVPPAPNRPPDPLAGHLYGAAALGLVLAASALIYARYARVRA